MYISMTGFGRAQKEEAWGTMTMEISSVNHRYQEISVKLPREFATYEPWFHQQLRKMFRRGKIQMRLEVLWVHSVKRNTINKELLISYCSDLADVRRQLRLNPDINIEQAALLPGVIDIPSFCQEDNSEVLETSFAELLKSAVDNWQNMRSLEGSHLRNEVLMHLEEFERIATEIEKLWAPTKDLAFATLKERVSEMLESIGEHLEEARYMQEIVLLSDKWDVAEELARLKSHIKKFRSVGDDMESSGRKLDFIVQEMNREVNTLDSKVADAKIRWLAVDAKAALERIREQIQNLE